MAIFIVVVEFCLVMLLFVKPKSGMPASSVFFALLSMFSLWVIRSKEPVTCHCFGDLVAPEAIGVAGVVRNAALCCSSFAASVATSYSGTISGSASLECLGYMIGILTIFYPLVLGTTPKKLGSRQWS
jgi:hypothetical protein